MTQRLFFKHLHPKPCSSGDLPPPTNGIIYVPAAYTECGGDTERVDYLEAGREILLRPVFRWRRDSVPAQRADLDARPHGGSFPEWAAQHFPLISRLKVRTSEHMDFEWDADYDFKTSRLDASNIFADYRRDSIFGSVGYSTLQALERFVHRHSCQPGNEIQPAASTAGVWRPDQARAQRRRQRRLRLYPECPAVWRHSVLLQLGLLWLSVSNIAAWRWGRCVTKISTASTSPWPE